MRPGLQLPGGSNWLRRTIRAAARRAIGPRGELALHRVYHQALIRCNRFGPPETPAMLMLMGGIAGEMATILDVGANVGRYSWLLRRHATPETDLYAFEPNPHARSILSANLGSHANVRILELALGDGDEEVFLNVPCDSSGNSVSALGHIERKATAESSIRTSVRRLDGLVDEGLVKPRPPIFIKVDIEGAELAFMLGAFRFLAQQRPIIYFECERAHLSRLGLQPETIWQLLSSLDYTVLAPSERLAPCGGPVPSISNYLAVPWSVPVELDHSSLLAELKQMAWNQRHVPEGVIPAVG